jgi:ABC-type nitrate/sulfonate/bicarbonate transport system substrate-binding protein
MSAFSRVIASVSLVFVTGLSAVAASATDLHADLKLHVAAEQGGLTALPEGFAVRDAAQLLNRPSDGGEQVIYVLSRVAGGFRVLTVTDAARRADPAAAERVVAALESARRWIEARPDAAAATLAGATGVTADAARDRIASGEFTTARPGPALAAFLKARADAVRVAAVDALIDDSAIRAVAWRAARDESLTALR